MNFTNNEIELIVQQVIKSLDKESLLDRKLPQIAVSTTYNRGDYGVFDKVEDAIEAANQAQKEYISKFELKDRHKLIDAIRQVCRDNVEKLAKMVRDESGIGRYEDKIQKHLAAINKTPGPECLKTEAITGDEGLMLEEMAPFGLIGAVTPVTNPTETIINNTISMLSGGNAVVFNVHPSAKKCCAFCLQLINQTIIENGGPENLITMTKEPTMDTVKVISQSPYVRLMVGTGGMAMVNELLRSGKKVIGAGAGNPPVIVDATANIKRAAKEIFMGASFDNNLLCLAEKEVFVEELVATDFIYQMVNEGAFLLNPTQLEQIMKLVLTYEETPQGKDYHVAKKWVGQDAGAMLEAIGITGKANTKLLICEVDHTHPFVILEQLMPVLPIVKCESLDQAIAYALKAESGNRHTASMFSTNVDHLTRFARAIQTTIFVKNAATLAGVGIGGEGHSTMTIAGPTGEGITCARSFTRRRRCVLADGGFRII